MKRVNYFGYSLEVPDDTVFVAMDGKNHDNRICAYPDISASTYPTKVKWIGGIEKQWYCGGSDFTELDLSVTVRGAIRLLTKPKHSLRRVS
jgi:hypothetical protein